MAPKGSKKDKDKDEKASKTEPPTKKQKASVWDDLGFIGLMKSYDEIMVSFEGCI